VSSPVVVSVVSSSPPHAAAIIENASTAASRRISLDLTIEPPMDCDCKSRYP
jgi:hypothetical protein